ncbi:polymorphic toxin type 43 domain-containing protein [Streptomyces sp. NPDC047821]|uniref:polymorphic toxin type 43 domain-containing protein n=1 Tax=Streptomyces sp. NPDC047821 TaxID=3365488 RepID=UPI00371EBA3D
MSRFGARKWVGVLAATVVASLLPAQATAVAAAAGRGPDLPQLRQPPTVPVTEVSVGGTKARGTKAAKWTSPKVVWPTAGSETVLLQAVTGAGRTPRQAGDLPVFLGAAQSKARLGAQAAGKVKVTVASQAAARKVGVEGLVLSLAHADAATAASKVDVRVDYASFKGAYGGDWAARLRLVQLPACALTTPNKPACRMSKPLPTANDTKSSTLYATAQLPGTTASGARAASAGSGMTVLAATAEPSGPTGDFKATSLTGSGSWTADDATGGFNWSYPVGVPSVPGGLQPSISLNYSSQSIDGRTAVTNNQADWIGDGWGWQPGYIERRYKSCNDDKTGGTNTTRVGDLCWYNDNATLSLGGKSTELVYDSTRGWHPASDSGEKVEKLTGASNPDKGTAGVDGVGEHWRVTTTDGTQYYFGLNKLPGWRDNGIDPDDAVTNSTWTVPVFGNQSGEPCYNASFAAAWCQQAWRWQLDYVVDPRGNAMAYYWKTEANNYGRNVSETTGAATVTPYIRGGWLDHIDYGLRSNAVYTGKPMGKVNFGVSERCLTSCTTFDETNAKNWPDVPFDLYCKDGSTECKDKYSPSFWSRKRLTSITTQVLTGGTYKDVDFWALKQNFPPSGDGISTPMWLESITRTGRAGGTAALPAVTFTGVQKPNRVDKLGDGLAPFIRLRMAQITTESGGTVGIDYYDPDCTAATLPPTDATNTTRCYPVKWAYEGETAKQDWFNAYAVQRVTEGDNLVESPDVVTEYTYTGGAEWAKSTDEFTKTEDRTYSVGRGYYLVQTRKGAGLDRKTLTETRYFRGMDGAAVKDSAGVSVTDREQFAGMVRDKATYNGDGGALLSATSYTPWRSAATATRSRTAADLPALEAYQTGTQAEEARTTVTGGTRTTKTIRTFDAYGMVATQSDLGDTAKTGDEQCISTSYARSSTSPILNAVSRTDTVAAACGATVSRPADVIDDVRNYYDGQAFGAAPTKGLVTKTDRINGAGSVYDVTTSTPATCGTASDQLCFDQYGRALATTDAYGKTTTTAYTPTTGEVPTATVVTNPLGHKVTTALDPFRGQPTKVTDPNGKVTSTAYDALGRVSKVWIPTRPQATYPNAPNHVFDYFIRNDGPVVVTSKSLDHNSQYQTSYAFFDGLLRARQTQETSPDRAGRLITESFYNTRGEAWLASGTYFAIGAAEPVLVTGQETNYPSSTETVFDGSGRPTAVIAKRFGDETKRTTTSYTGDATTVVPPEGGTATTTVVDALGRTVELKQYTNADRSASQSTIYGYNKHGRLEQVTDASGAKWTYGYDTRGRQITVSDPDKGSTTTFYDKGDRVTDVKDARLITLHTDYDDLGRRTALKKGTTTLASWTYDTLAKGQPTAATRYSGGNAYVSEITEYNDLYQPVGTKVTIPTAEGQLAGTYEWFNFYNDNTGHLEETEHPETGGLPAESVVTNYNTGGLLVSAYAGQDPLISDAGYDHYGRPQRLEYGEFGRHLWTTNEYDDHTGALTRSYADREVAPQRIEDTRYSYDPAGNITSIGTAYGQDATRTTDTQCFAMDALRRITEAWTNTGEQCATAPSATVVGGPDAYWTSYTYDAVGNRKTETQHKTASGPTADTVRTYAAPPAGKHQLPSVTQTGATPHNATYTYDASGNTETRKSTNTASPLNQTLLWDDEGHLAKVTDGTKTSTYLYDTDGQRLIGRDSTGTTTLYLPNGNELEMDKVGLVTGTRYYGAGGKTVAMRTNNKLTYILTDHQNTSTTQVTNDATQAVTRRKTTIFGAPRGSQPTNWTGDKGFVGGTNDTDTSLTHIGAREYDPTIGRFISVDPIMDLADSQQLHGYTYANNNPVTYSDPTGLMPDHGGGTSSCTYPCKPEAAAAVAAGPTSPPNQPNQGGGKSHDNGKKGVMSQADSAFTDAGGNTWTFADNNPKLRRAYIDRYEYKLKTLDYRDAQQREMAQLSAALSACQSVYGDERCWSYLEAYHAPMHARGELLGWDARIGALPAGARYAKAVKGNPCTKCFLAGTDVLLADGSTKDIEDIKAGDAVLATNPLTGETEARKVTKLIVTDDDKRFNTLTLQTGTGTEKLTATYEHPFWSPSERRWIEAQHLTAGMTLLTDTGATVTVQANRPFTKHARTYNLTVDDLHTYYVLAGETPVLVHNSNCLINGSGPAKGVLEVSDRVKSVRAVTNFSPKGERDFIFDPTTGRFATGADQGVGGHDFLGSAVGADKSTMVGGRLRRGPNGELQTNQWSGHYGMNWNDSARKAFQDFMSQRGITVSHTPSMHW